MKHNWKVPWIFLAPGILFITFNFIIPMFMLFGYSMTSYELIGNGNWVGVKNYIDLFNDPAFVKSLNNTIYMILLMIVILNALALGAGVFLFRGTAGEKAFRIIFFLPVVIGYVAVSIFWKLILNYDIGLINSILTSIGLNKIPFLIDPQNAFGSIIFSVVWKDWAYFLIFYLVGLRAIPQEYYESASVDGVNVFQQFWHITVPLLSRTILFVTVIITIRTSKMFIPVMVMTGGGPHNSSNILIYHAWKRAFVLGDVGAASAIAVVLFLILTIFAVAQFLLIRPKERA